MGCFAVHVDLYWLFSRMRCIEISFRVLMRAGVGRVKHELCGRIDISKLSCPEWNEPCLKLMRIYSITVSRWFHLRQWSTRERDGSEEAISATARGFQCGWVCERTICKEGEEQTECQLSFFILFICTDLLNSLEAQFLKLQICCFMGILVSRDKIWNCWTSESCRICIIE